MQLTKLDIKGFKSFGDKISINFNEGVTAIVGPNGCGKSNVVDAIRWVLGEQSTRMLRSEKMENIIFNGTKTRKAANLAEVSLTFDNTKNVLPTEFSQVTITRKLYRNGESEYRLNDVKCRLKDITDLFLDTGIGPDSYSIIELRMIDEIINNKDHSRRNLFEEASGISKYKIRKRQTLNKLKHTQTDLERVEDLLFEIEKNLKTLENQAKKAERYYKLKEEYKAESTLLATLRIRDFQRTLDRLNEEALKKRAEQSKAMTHMQTKEAELQALKHENLTKEKNLSLQQKVTNEHINKIRSYESDKKVKNEQLRNLQSQESRLNEEIAQDKQQLNHIYYNVKRMNAELLEEEAKLETSQVGLEQKRVEVEEMRGQQQSLKGRIDRATEALNQSQREIHALEKEIAVLTIQREALEQERMRNTEDQESREEEMDEFKRVILNLEDKQQHFDAEHQQIHDQEAQLQQQLADADDQLVRLNQKVQQENRHLDSAKNEYALTKSMVDNLEGFPESIRFLRKHAQWKKQYPLLSDVLFCQEAYRIAIENYLEPVMNHYVVETEKEAIHALHLLRDASRGRASFFVLNQLQQSDTFVHPKRDVHDGQLIPALDVVSVEAPYKQICTLLLQDVYLLKEANSTEDHPLPYPEAIVLHPEGKFWKNRTGYSGGSVGLFEGKRIGRVKNLENLSKTIKQTTALVERIEQQIEDWNKKITTWKAQSKRGVLVELDTQLNRVNQELLTVKTKYEQHQTFISNSQNRKIDIDQKISQIAESFKNADPKLLELKSVKTAHEVELAELHSSYQELSDVLTDKSTIFNQENLQFHQQQNRVDGILKDLDYRHSQQDILEKRLDKNQTIYSETKHAIQEILQHVDDSDDNLMDMYAQRDQLEEGLKALEEEFYTDREKTHGIEQDIKELRRLKESQDDAIAEVKERENDLKISLNSLKERLSIEFNIDIRDLIDTNENDQDDTISEDEVILAQKTERLKKRLDDFGSINPMAMEAYEEMNERYTFIIKEKQDLLDAKSSLLETIQEIDAVAKEKFMESFNHVRENFIQVFRSLFNAEDNCDLVLTNPESPLESDIDIIARPKGKRPLSINQLSGGEKTLTATALLFALYLLKPAPFCVFDEVDAPLDDTNIDKFNNIIREFSSKSQFIIVSHNKRTIASTDIIYGVTMVEQGVSRVVAVDLREVA